MTDTVRNHQSQEPYVDDDEIDLKELFRVLWVGRWVISGITVAGTIIAVIIALVLPNIYRAEALLAPTDQEAAGGLSALAAQYGGLASLAGINIGGGSTNKTALGLEILKSRRFISEFVERHDILVPLVAATGWDADSGKLIVDAGDYDVTAEKWIRDVSPPKKTVPSMQEAYEEFMDILSVSQDKTSGFVTVAVEHYSPEAAMQWVDWLVEDLNSSIMLQDVAEAEQAIEYLNKQIESTPLADLQNVFFNLIEEQTKTVMLAKVSDEYLLKTIDPAVIPEKRYRPQRVLLVLLGTLAGTLIGVPVTLIIVTTRFRRARDKSRERG